MVGHVSDLAPYQQRELLGLLTQESTELLTDAEILAGLSETLRRQLSLGAANDLAEGFRRRMIRVAEALSPEPHPDGYYDFRSDRAIASEILEQVRVQANALSSDANGDFMADFAKTFQTMSQDRRAAWLRKAALAANAAEPDAATQHAADAAKEKSSADDTALRIAADVAGIVYSAARRKVAARASSAAPAVGANPPKLAAAPLGLVAGGVVAYTIRQRRRAAQQKARDVVQVRRERQATQAVVTTCAYLLAVVDEG